MGQRHQCFIHMPNFSKSFYKGKLEQNHEQESGKLTAYVELMTKKDADDKAFGEKDTTVLAWHHQWLYGRSAPLACLNVLDFLSLTNKRDGSTNPFSTDYRGDSDEPKDIVRDITSVLSLFRDVQLSPQTRGAGIERFSFLNYEEPEMREDFTRGDNNDGIFIVDAITGKYCFMNISEQDKRNTKVSALPTLTPCSAMEYIEAYYPSTMTAGAKAHIKWLQGKENRKYKSDKGLTGAQLEEQIQSEVTKYEAELKENASINKKFAKRFKKYKILTLEEVAAMSPVMEDVLVNQLA